jgi:hypothetical protein
LQQDSFNLGDFLATLPAITALPPPPSQHHPRTFDKRLEDLALHILPSPSSIATKNEAMEVMEEIKQLQ